MRCNGLFLSSEHLGRQFDESSPTCILFFSGDQLISFAHQSHALGLKISAQWLSEEGRLWTCVPKQSACEFVSLKSSHIMPGQHSQPTTTSLNQGIKGVYVFSCRGHLLLLQNDHGLLRVIAVTRGESRGGDEHRNKSTEN